MATLSKRLDDLEALLRSWLGTADRWLGVAQAGALRAHNGEQIVRHIKVAMDDLARIPRTQELADKAVEEWDYQGVDVLADLAAIETALMTCGDWVAARDTQMWAGYAIAPTYPWQITEPVFTAAQTVELQTALSNLKTAINTFLANIP